MIRRIALRSILKTLTARFVVRWFREARTSLQKRRLPKTKERFLGATVFPEYLESNVLGTLQRRYPFPSEYGYDSKSIERRGEFRAREILRLPRTNSMRSFLELGCWDGMVSCSLHRRSKETTAIDLRSEGFDKRAQEEGVALVQMDAENLQFADESYDCIFSYDSFEHFRHPDVVLQNALRVLKKNGLLYLVFGPLYMSPFGQHAYRSITVPYCQFLFPRSALVDFVASRGLERIEFENVNEWPVTRFRKLWAEYASRLRCVGYSEILNLKHLQLVNSYPTCFRSKTSDFDNLIVESIEIALEKTC